jgi:hypothetical protein
MTFFFSGVWFQTGGTLALAMQGMFTPGTRS